jgi:hypothetical protein
MLDPGTLFDVIDLLASAGLKERGIHIHSLTDYVVGHLHADNVYLSRAEDGALRGVAIGWPAYSGRIFYCHLLVVDTEHGATVEDIGAALSERVHERHPSVTHYGYRRAKHGDRVRLYALERLSHG